MAISITGAWYKGACFMFGRKTYQSSRSSPQPPKPRHQKPVLDLKTVRRHQKREEKRIKELEKGLKEQRLGLYLHIPFCKSKCAYCDFYSLAGHEPRMDAYLNALTANIREMATAAAGRMVDTVYIGGGTPSFFGEKRLKALIKVVTKSFVLDKDLEFTVECNPESVTLPLIKTLYKLGVNRISLGMQSAQDAELKAVGRPHTFEQVQKAVELIRKAKIDNLSLDLIYGLPEQSMEHWKQNVEAALALYPEHLSLYALTLEEGTPLWKSKEAGRVTLANDDELADRYLWAVDRLKAAGYEQYEISNFCRPGHPSRHNLKYWRGEEYVGLGPAAHSDYGGCRYSYVPNLEAYIDGMMSGKPIVEESEQIPEKERAREYLMLRLRTVEGICSQEYSRFRMSFVPIEEQLHRFAAEGWSVQEGGRWHFTPKGFLLSNTLIGSILDAQEVDMMKHSAVSLRNS